MALRIGAPLVRLNFDQQRYEADFRLSVARVHDNAESIALTRGEANERVRFRARFTRILISRLLPGLPNSPAVSRSARRGSA